MRFLGARRLDLGLGGVPMRARLWFDPAPGALRRMIYLSPLEDVEDSLVASLSRTEELTANLTLTESQVASLHRTEEFIADLEKGYR